MNFIAKALIKRQLKGMPEEQVDQLIAMIEKNPEFFQKIAEEIQAKTTAGMGQQEAAMEVMKKYQNELKDIAKDSGLAK